MYVCDDTVVAVLPLIEVLDMTSGDNYLGTVLGILDAKRKDPWYPALLEAIRAEGFTIPIRIDSDGWVVDGHHRVAAAMELGMEWIPVTSHEWPDHSHSFRQDHDPNYTTRWSLW